MNVQLIYTYIAQKATIHQVTTMLATSENVLFPGHNHHANHQYWWPNTLIIAQAPASEGSSVSVVSMDLHDGYELEIGHF